MHRKVLSILIIHHHLSSGNPKIWCECPRDFTIAWHSHHIFILEFIQDYVILTRHITERITASCFKRLYEELSAILQTAYHNP